MTIDITYDVFDGLASTGTSAQITITGVNDAPILTSETSFSVAEGNTDVGTITATDIDSPDLSYSILGGADAALFTIDAATGALSFADAPDFETPGSSGGSNDYEVQIGVSDGDISDDEFVFVSVTDVNEGTPRTPIFGTSGSDRNLVGTEDADIINSLEGRSDSLTGLGGGDVFDFSDTSTNGSREIRRITDFDAAEGDLIDIGSAEITNVRVVRGSTYVYLNEDRDLLILTDVSDFDFDTLL